MKEVILYTAHKKLVRTFRDQLQLYSSQPLVFSRNSEDAFLKHDVSVDNVDVRRFSWWSEDGTIEDMFVAFDRDLENIINVIVDERTHKRVKDATEQLLVWQKHLGDQIKDLESRTIWGMMKLKFSKWWFRNVS